MKKLQKVFSCAFVILGILAPVSMLQAEESGEKVVKALNTRISGDLDALLEQGFIRVLSVRNPIYFNLNSFEHTGYLPDKALEFEKFLQKEFGAKAKNLKVLLIPVSRDRLIPYLEQGKGDIAIANLTITEERQKKVAFTEPVFKGVREILITSKKTGPKKSLDDLGSVPVHLRKSSSYFSHLVALNEQRKKEGKQQVVIKQSSELLEDYEMLEMMQAGALPAMIIDSHKAKLWSSIFKGYHINDEVAIASDGSIAWAVRKNAPDLLKTANKFVQTIRKGSLLGNVLINKHLKGENWIENVHDEEAMKRFDEVVDHIKSFASEYDFDWLMITAQGYQESRLDQSKKSHMGAIGVMQVLPSTAKDRNVGIPDIHEMEQNVHAGVKYLRFLRDHYYSSSDYSKMDQVMFAFAAYNAGPGNVNKAKKRAEKLGLDPNIWFENTEIAMAEAVSREPVIYVRNILKYFIAYSLLVEEN